MKIRIIAIAVLAAVAALAAAGDSADVMLAKINAVKPPAVDRSKVNDKSYVQSYYAEVEKTNRERNKLILEFYKAYPDNDEAEKQLNRRWGSMAGVGRPATADEIAAINADIDSIVPHASEKVKVDGSYWKAHYAMVAAGDNFNKAAQAADSFTKAYPTDPRGAMLLREEVQLATTNDQKRLVYEHMAKDYKDKYAPGIIRQMDSVGKPFDLTFKDATTGKDVSIKDLKGKVVLIDFWATWCGPCIARMPEMKKLYADMHAKGLEVIGVSHDQPEAQGGLTKLKDYVAKNDIAWPQYYQGNFWSSEFSTSWGINSIPCVFLIDKNGNLAEVTYPANLDEKVNKLLGNN